VTLLYTAQIEAPEKKSQSSMLPVLIVLFVISYAILTLLVVEQGRTIEAQRGLLHEMLKDSTQLATLKGQIARGAATTQQHNAAPQADAPAGNGAKSGAGTANDKDSKRSAKPRAKETPERPASDLRDVRRSTRVI